MTISDLERILGSKDLFSSNLDNKIRQQPKNFIEQSGPSNYSKYTRMHQLAEYVDDFKEVLKVYQSALENVTAYELQQANRALLNAFDTFVSTQTKFAEIFAKVGDYEAMDQHLQNMHFAFQYPTGRYSKETAEPKLDAEKIERIVDECLEKASPSYFIAKVDECASNGDYKKIKKYIGLTFNVFDRQGLVKGPVDPRTGRIRKGLTSDDIGFDRFLSLYSHCENAHNKSYNKAAEKVLSEAIHLAVQTNDFAKKGNINRIYRIFAEAKKILLEKSEKLTPPSLRSDAYEKQIAYGNEVLNPTMAELAACRLDPDHPLREIMGTSMKYKRTGTVYELRDKRPKTSDVALSLKRQPTAIHEFYLPIMELYGHISPS